MRRIALLVSLTLTLGAGAPALAYCPDLPPGFVGGFSASFQPSFRGSFGAGFASSFAAASGVPAGWEPAEFEAFVQEWWMPRIADAVAQLATETEATVLAAIGSSPLCDDVLTMSTDPRQLLLARPLDELTRKEKKQRAAMESVNAAFQEKLEPLLIEAGRDQGDRLVTLVGPDRLTALGQEWAVALAARAPGGHTAP